MVKIMHRLQIFASQNPLCVVFIVLAVISWAITIAAMLSSKRTGKHVSGLPALGGFLVFIGFLTSSRKWLALLGFLDPMFLYFVIKIIPDIIAAERYEKNYIPPSEFDGGTLIAYTGYGKEYEELRYPAGYPGSYEVHRINRYCIIQKDTSYFLLKIEHTDRIISRSEYKTPDECKRHASDKAKWKAYE